MIIFTGRPPRRDRLPGPVQEDRPPHLAQLRLRLRLQPGRDPGCRRGLLPSRPQAAALDGLGRHGLELRLRRGLLAPTQALPEAGPGQAGDGRVPEVRPRGEQGRRRGGGAAIAGGDGRPGEKTVKWLFWAN